MQTNPLPESWWLYAIECADGHLYIGIAKNVEVRYAEHVAGRGAMFTRLHAPQRLLMRVRLRCHRDAARAERWMKRMSAMEKRRWVFALSGGYRDCSETSCCVTAVDVDQVSELLQPN